MYQIAKLVLALLRLLRRAALRLAFAGHGARCPAISKQFRNRQLGVDFSVFFDG
jgi:hypothetical protein